MARWDYTVAETQGGLFQLVVTKLTPGGRTVDVSFVRDKPTQMTSFSEADPFGDSTAVFSFPAVTGWDDLKASDLAGWLDYYSNVDLFWVPAVPFTSQYIGNDTPLINPLTNLRDVVAPTILRAANGAVLGDNRVKVWEGFIANFGFTQSDTSDALEIQCQGALFQVDRYLQKPFFPASPWPLEALLQTVFDHAQRPHLRTQLLRIDWPGNWQLTIPPFTTRDTYTLVGTPGTNFSGYSSRETGGWDHSLTAYAQNQLAVMLTDERCGVAPGNQWTILQERTSSANPGRQPVLSVRDRFRPPDFSYWYSQPGVNATLSGDSTQSENVVFGDGTAVDGTVWRNAVIANDGSRTDYLPLAYGNDVYPAQGNPAYIQGGFVSEARISFDSGFDQPAAASTAKQSLTRDREPGWTGTITVKVDPPEMSRWLIRAGMTVLLKGFLGTGDAGFPLHVSAKVASPANGTVELTVDSRYRDLSTVEQAIQRTRDPLTPIKMLQVNRTSVMIEDIQAPWDYSAGSGYIPKASKGFYDYAPNTEIFPYEDWATKHPPNFAAYTGFYATCNAGAPNAYDRWVNVPILTSEAGTIARTELACYDYYGRLLKIPFHLSIYNINVNAGSMPRTNGNYSAFQPGAFEKINESTGQAWPGGNYNAPDASMIQGWGNVSSSGVFNRAGFYPGRESDGASPTGVFMDDSTWTYDNSKTSANYHIQNAPGTQQEDAITLWMMIYAEYWEPVYFMGRLFRQSQRGT